MTALAILAIVVILVVIMPVGFLMSTTIAAATIGTLLTDRAEDDHAESELLETNY